MKKDKTIGVIGLGSIGRRHSDNLIKMGQTEVIGYDPDTSKHTGKWTCGDLDFLLKMTDLVLVCSPTDRHLEHIKLALSAGKKVFAEKPIADRYDPELKNVTMVGYNLRVHSCVKKAKEWMPRIGDPLWANFTLGQHSEKPPYLRDGVVLNWSHELDLCLYLLGPGRVAASNTRLSNGHDDISDILITHDNGCRSGVHLDYVTKPEVRQFIIAGSKLTIIVDLRNRIVWLCEKDGMVDHFEGLDDWDDNYIEEMRAFLDRCDGKETLGCTAEEALKVLDICLEVRKQAGLL